MMHGATLPEEAWRNTLVRIPDGGEASELEKATKACLALEAKAERREINRLIAENGIPFDGIKHGLQMTPEDYIRIAESKPEPVRAALIALKEKFENLTIRCGDIAVARYGTTSFGMRVILENFRKPERGFVGIYPHYPPGGPCIQFGGNNWIAYRQSPGSLHPEMKRIAKEINGRMKGLQQVDENLLNEFASIVERTARDLIRISKK